MKNENLYICATHFQILSSISISNNKNNESHHIIITNSLSLNNNWIKFFKKTKIFNSVSILPERTPILKYKHLFWNSHKDRPISIKNRIKAILSFESPIKKWLREATTLVGENPINNKGITNIFIGSPIAELWEIGKLFIKQNDACELYGLDEGLSSYMPNAFNTAKIKGAYLFAPELALHNHPTSKIPPLDREELHNTWLILKSIFSTPEIDDGYYFFDQPIGVPTPLTSINDWKNRPYTLKKNEILSCIYEVTKNRSTKFLYLPHPRQPKTITNHYLDLGYETFFKGPACPFELALLTNQKKIGEQYWVTIFSGAIVMPSIAFSQSINRKSIFIYELFGNDSDIKNGLCSDALKVFLKKLSDTYPNRFFIPKNKNELLALLK